MAAAQRGHAEAQCNLGYMYSHGKGLPVDEQLAFKWYEAAAENGSARAQNNLGVIYKEGRGATQDYEQAVKQLNGLVLQQSKGMLSHKRT